MGTALLNFFVQMQALTAVGALLSLFLRTLGRLPSFPLSARAELKIHYLLFSTLALFSLLPFKNDGDFQLRPFAKVMEMKEPAGMGWASASPAQAIVIENRSIGLPAIPLQAFGWGALLLAAAGFFRVLRDLFRLSGALGRALVIRRIGRVRIAVLEEEVSPFSACSLSGGAWVVLPDSIWARPEELRVATRHELQHHRQRDALWCYLFAPLRAICFFHPLRVLWGELFAEIQELACDEALVSQKKISAGVYARCLISAAETAGRRGAGRAYAAAPALFSERRILKRRIESMFITKKESKWLGWALGVALGISLGASAWASGHWVVESRVSFAEAKAMAAKAKKTGDFPIAVNEAVLKELNHYLGTEKGRAFVARAMANLTRLRPRFERKLAEHGAPEELLAVGLIESAYENLPQSANPFQHGAGIWQFIPNTARVFGMRVDSQVDERLDIDLETEAAIRYLTANKLRFNDWLLGIMAYNMGERALDNAIREAGTRDPWELVRRGYENDTSYLPKFMAALLILKNPEQFQ